MATECIATFDMFGRTFTVLHKPSAAYLRADGRMWGDSLGSDLTPEEAIEQAKLRAEIMLIQERQQEEKLVHRLFEKPLAPEVAAMADDYVCFTAVVPAPRGRAKMLVADAVYAPFNQNTYVNTRAGWRFAGSFASHADAVKGLVMPTEPQAASLMARLQESLHSLLMRLKS